MSIQLVLLKHQGHWKIQRLQILIQCIYYLRLIRRIGSNTTISKQLKSAHFNQHKNCNIKQLATEMS